MSYMSTFSNSHNVKFVKVGYAGSNFPEHGNVVLLYPIRTTTNIVSQSFHPLWGARFFVQKNALGPLLSRT
jgi:hypothetical protein